jgi:hypothetical protein
MKLILHSYQNGEGEILRPPSASAELGGPARGRTESSGELTDVIRIIIYQTSGGGEIRTHGAYSAQQFSRLSRSSTLAPLRSIDK